MSNIRHGALIKSPLPVVLKRSSAHFDMVSSFTGDPSQDVESTSEMASAFYFQASAKKHFVATAGLEIKSYMVGYPQINHTLVGQSILSQFGLQNAVDIPGAPGGFAGAWVFPFNRWNMAGHGTLTPSTEISAYPATNTYLQQRSKIWRSTSTTASLTRNLANPYRISAVCIVSHNLTKDGTVRIRVGNDSTFVTNKYDSGTVPIWEPSFATSGPYEEEADSSGYPTNELIALLKYCGENPRTVRWVVFDEVNAQHIRIDFVDTTNPHSLIEVAYVYAGVHVRVRPDQVYGWILHPVGVSRIKKSASGSPWIDIFYRQVVVTASFNSQPEAQTMAFWNLLAGLLGKRKELIIAFQPDNLPKKFWFTLYGRLQQTPQMTNVALVTYNEDLIIEELVG